jgi:hypothetical protein
MHNGQQSACGAESDGGVSLFFVSTCVLKNKQWVNACWITLTVVHDLAAGHIRWTMIPQFRMTDLIGLN